MFVSSASIFEEKMDCDDTKSMAQNEWSIN